MQKSSSVDPLVVMGMAVSGLLHELGNHLHRIGWQAAILQRQLGEEVRPDLELIRKECRDAAALIAPLQERRSARDTQRQTIDLAKRLDLKSDTPSSFQVDPQTLDLLIALAKPKFEQESLEGCRWILERDGECNASPDAVWEEAGPFSGLDRVERFALARAARETESKCLVQSDNGKIRVCFEWSEKE